MQACMILYGISFTLTISNYPLIPRPTQFGLNETKQVLKKYNKFVIKNSSHIAAQLYTSILEE